MYLTLQIAMSKPASSSLQTQMQSIFVSGMHEPYIASWHHGSDNDNNNDSDNNNDNAKMMMI